MEYLMTYGWAILIIAVSLAALFGLGVFNSSGSAPTACIAASGYSCGGISIVGTNNLAPGEIAGSTFAGQFEAQVGQNTGGTAYNSFFIIAPQSSPAGPTGFPTEAEQFPPGNTGLLMPAGAINSIYVIFNSLVLTSNTLGSSFVGSIWMNYSPTISGAATQSVKIAVFSLKVS